MRTFTLNRTLIAMSAIMGTALASDPSQRRTEQVFDILDSNNEVGGLTTLANMIYQYHAQDDVDASSLQEAMEKSTASRLRAANMRSKGMKSSKKSKKCKSEGSKGASPKYGKKRGILNRNTPTRAPTNKPTPEPTEECFDGYFNGYPGGSNSFSNAPSLAPSSDLEGTLNDVAKSFCSQLDAAYGFNGDNEKIIEVWTEGNDKGRTANGVAAVSSVIGSPIKVSDTDEYDVSVSMLIDESAGAQDSSADANGDSQFDLVDVGMHLDKIVSPSIALYLVGCVADAQSVAEAYYWDNVEEDAARKLNENTGSVFTSLRDWLCDYTSGETCSSNGMCPVTCKTSLNYIGDLDASEISSLLSFSLKEYLSLMDDVTGFYPMQVIDSIEVGEVATEGDSDSNVDAVVDQDFATERSMKAGPFIGAATGLLAVLLLLILFVRRRNRYDQEEVSHLKLDESADEDTFYNGSDGDSIGVTKHEYNTRDIHIVGEGDSVISHWTGYTGNSKKPAQPNSDMNYNKSALVNGINADVHQCSSATCEICAQKRQAGLNFISTGVTDQLRSRSLPSDVSREYTTEDTVEL